MNRRQAAGICSRILVLASATIVIAILAFIICEVVGRGAGSLTWQLISTTPSYLNGTIGILPDIANTIYLLLFSLVLALPIGVISAIYLTEYAHPGKIESCIEFAIETLSGIPSIIYGLVGMLVFCQLFNFKTSLAAGACTLAIMNIPTVIRTVQESLKTVPQSYREGALALGSGKGHTIWTVVLPNAIDGIMSGCILSAGRVTSESAALLFTAGFAHSLVPLSEALSSPGASLSVALYVYAKEQGEFGVAFAIAIMLLIITFLINLAAMMIAKAKKKQI
ncbi:MAG: phosphate ABC transporter permease PstA [Sphaerochaetaceae bacterium]|nr:phosphate ABC transporter permease PstA [Sphaerochaetaceae bacterium]MDD3162553.1 phosphate ABC transporter permease PstA [Sphaerochaetaceae bacterium]MDD4006357.1 phosphate ABC transporter permease PstA [Sphaerochaetaceae bacterium]MDD4396032.1 phosphate ABC transporter permease PstA [Sphaerochaetaceae bacterium]